MNWQAAGWWSTIATLLFAFVLFHELGHALAARNRGVVAERIILFPLGGGAYLPEQPKRVWEEVFVYGAGPLANILIALVAWIILLTRPDGALLIAYYLKLSGNLVVLPGIIDQILGITLAVNLLLALGNLLPAYPLDGGRILRALLRRPLGARSATVVVTFLGVVIGIGLAWLGVKLSDPLLVLGAGFIILLSILEYQNGWQRRRLAGKKISLVLRQPSQRDLIVHPEQTVEQVRKLFHQSGWPVLPVYNQWNEQVGFVEASVIEEEAKEGNQPVRPYCEREFVTAAPGEQLLEVTERIVDANVYGASVIGPRGKLVGYVFTEDIMPLLDTPFKKLKRRLGLMK